MSFNTLPIEAQNLLMSNHSYITKWLVYLSIILFSSYYLFVVWQNHKQTKYITTAIMRFLLYALSLVYLLASPIMLLLMTPDYSFLDFYTVPVMIYGVFAGIIFVLLFIDVIRYGVFVMLKMAGLDLEDSNVNEIANELENNKHFLKFKKGKKW